MARGAVRSPAGASNSRSSTACTSVPRVAASLGFSGSRSITRNRYSNGHCMKSPAREGDKEVGAVALRSSPVPAGAGTGTGAVSGAACSTGSVAAGIAGSGVRGGVAGGVSTAPPGWAAASSMLLSMSTDLTARH